MRYAIAPEIFGLFPGMRVAVAVAEGVDNTSPRPAVEALWRESWERAGALATEYANAQSHPHVAPWRGAFKAMGVSSKEFRSSIEAMLRRAMRGGEPFSINPLVDFYNGISLRHISPAGGFDLNQLGTDLLELRLSRAGEEFLALGASEPELVPAGEVSVRRRRENPDAPFRLAAVEAGRAGAGDAHRLPRLRGAGGCRGA
ncbi:MAG: phenylalanine--tRNA ligase beta subunit-related protein [Baekduia sp.]